MWASVPIPVKRCNTRLLRLLDLERWPRRDAARPVIDGFHVVWDLPDEQACTGCPRMLAIAVRPRRFTLHADGKDVRLELEVWGETPVERGGSPQPLAPADVGARLVLALVWPAGEKFLVPRPSDVFGLTGFDAYLLDRPQVGESTGLCRSVPLGMQATPRVTLPLRWAWVHPEAQTVARQWADAMAGRSLRPFAVALGLPVDWCVESPNAKEESWQTWLTVGFCLDGWPDDGEEVVLVNQVFVGGHALTYFPRGASQSELDAGAEAALSVVQAWPGTIGLVRLPDEGPYVQVSVHLGRHPVVAEATQPLARVALRELLRGRPVETLRSRLRALWDDPAQLQALTVLSSL